MTQEQLIYDLVGSPALDLVVTIKDTAETKLTARFLALTFESSSQVAMKLEITTVNKDITVSEQGESIDMDPIVFAKVIRADEKTQIPVTTKDGAPVLDENGIQLTIPENVYWKYLTWERPLDIPLKVLLESVIKIKFNLSPDTFAFVLPEEETEEKTEINNEPTNQ